MLPDRKLNRWQEYDYACQGLYFITSCVQDMACVLGEVINGLMQENAYGRAVRDWWLWLAVQYPYVRLHEFVVMPNHVHGILEICHDLFTGISADGRFGIRPDGSTCRLKSVSSLVGAMKMKSSRQIHELGFPEFAWKRSFHDRVIRNYEEYRLIANYIENNPARWSEDRFHP